MKHAGVERLNTVRTSQMAVSIVNLAGGIVLGGFARVPCLEVNRCTPTFGARRTSQAEDIDYQNSGGILLVPVPYATKMAQRHGRRMERDARWRSVDAVYSRSWLFSDCGLELSG